MSYPLLATKLFAPSLRHDYVSRPRLLQKLNKGLRPEVRLVLISAPAGFGKTTLVSEWIKSINLPVAWLSLDEADNDPARLWQYILSALQRHEPQVGTTMEAALQAPQPPTFESLINLLINDLSTLDRSLGLVLDDFHLLDAPQAHESIDYFIDHLPSNIHMIILTRADPAVHLARRRAGAELLEIRATDLKFEHQETENFLTRTMKLSLHPEDIHALEQRTEGWIAGLQMAAIAIQTQLASQEASATRQFVAKFSGDDRYIADYLLEEVLQRLPESVREFLLQTSILQRFNDQLCNALTARQESQEILSYLENANLFIVPLDNRREWFRYHHLFAQLLLQNLFRAHGKQAAGHLYRKAARWHLENHFPIEAVEYALQGEDFEQAAQTILSIAEQMFLHSELTTLHRWGEALPESILAVNPGLCVALGWAANATNHPAQFEKLMGLVERWTGITVDEFLAMNDQERHSLPASVLGALVELTVQRTRRAIDHGDFPAILDVYRKILPYLSPERDTQPFIYNIPSALYPPMVFMIALAHELSGDPRSAIQGFEQAASSALAHNNSHIIALSLGHLGQLQMALGNLHDASHTFQQAADLAATPQGQVSAFFGMAFIGLGALAYERNDLLLAQEQLEKGIEMGKLWNSWEVLLPGYFNLARLYSSLEEHEQLADILNELHALGYRNPDLILPQVEAHQAYLALRQGDLQAAQAWANMQGYQLKSEISPRSFEHAEILARLLLAQNQAAQASSLLDRQLEAEQNAGLLGIWIRMKLLAALALDLQGQRSTSLEHLEDALALGSREGYVRVFIDAGQPMANLLRTCVIQGIYSQYASSLLAALSEMEPAQDSTGDSSETVDVLTSREIEILQLLASGASNAEIASQAFITVNTVKKHITNIYAKLQVSSRLQAVDRARVDGIIH